MLPTDDNLIAIIENYDISKGNKEIAIEIPTNTTFSIQSIWRDTTGTKNGTVSLQSANKVDLGDGKAQPWDDISGLSSTINSVDGSDTLSYDYPYTSKYLNIKFLKVGLTGGKLSIYMQKFNNAIPKSI